MCCRQRTGLLPASPWANVITVLSKGPCTTPPPSFGAQQSNSMLLTGALPSSRTPAAPVSSVGLCRQWHLDSAPKELYSSLGNDHYHWSVTLSTRFGECAWCSPGTVLLVKVRDWKPRFRRAKEVQQITPLYAEACRLMQRPSESPTNIHLSNKYLLGTYYMPDTVLGYRIPQWLNDTVSTLLSLKASWGIFVSSSLCNTLSTKQSRGSRRVAFLEPLSRSIALMWAS